MLERLRVFESKQSGEQPDWRAIATALYEAPQAWRRIGPVERRAIREAEAEFDATLGRLRARYEAWQAQNAADKRSLIERASALLEKPDGREAVDGAKRLQQQWRDIGPAPRALEESLWNEFRTHCDNVFKKRQQAFAEHAASLEGSKAQALALCDELEQLATQSDASLLEGAKALPEKRAAFEALGELPRSEARALQERFKRAVSRCELKVREHRALEAAQQFDHLIEASQRIQAYGWAIANQAPATESDGLKSQAEAFVAGVSQWPKGGAAALKDAWAKAEAACAEELAANETALRTLCIRAEIATERATPVEDQELRRSYQLQRLVQSMGQRHEPSTWNWEALAFEWLRVGPVSPETRTALFARFAQCRA